MCLLWIFSEVIDLAVGMGHQVGVFLEAEVVLQDGGDQEGQLGVSGIGGVFEVVLAIAVGVIERMRQNIEIFDFSLSDEDMAAIDTLDTGKSLFFDHHDAETARMFMGWR